LAKILISTKDIDRNTWLQERKKGIGGSDAAAALGLSRWKTPFQVYIEKTEEIQSDQEENERMYWGNVMEDVIAKEFERRTGKKVRRRNAILQHEEFPFMLANLDREVVSENAGLECKNANEYALREWEGEEVPLEYLIQCNHYMAVTGCEKWYIATLIGGNKYKYKEILRDEALIQAIIEGEQRFWNDYVLAKNPPPIDGSSAAEKYIAERFKKAERGKTVELGVQFKTDIERLNELKDSIAALSEAKTAIENRIKLEMADAERGYTGQWEVRWPTITSNRVDTKVLKEQYPDVYKRVIKETTFRRFEIKEVE
jgi:putative phage-type endonuclease